MGILDLRELNMCFLASWVQRYYDSKSKLWREIIDCKYIVECNIFCCVDRNASLFWKGVIWVARAAKMGFRWKYGDGKRIRFWED
jgi:hypothetical protein